MFVLSYTQSLAGELRGSGRHRHHLLSRSGAHGFGERAGFSKEDAEAALPAVMWVSAEEAARSAVEGMAKGRLVVIPGKVDRLAAAVFQVTPRTLLLPVLTTSHAGPR